MPVSLLEELMYFAEHRSDCAVRVASHCDCGLRELLDQTRKLIGLAMSRVAPKEEL